MPNRGGNPRRPEYTTNDPYQNPEPANLDYQYLGDSTQSHFRNTSDELPDDVSAAYTMQRDNSSTPLHSDPSQGYNLNQSSSRPTVPQGVPVQHIHYPPDPPAQSLQPGLPYTSVPLRDMPESRSGQSSGATTPNGSGNRKKWSFLPMHHGNGSAEAGQMGEKVIPKRPKGSSRHGSWDLLGNGAEWEGYNPAEASVENLRYAEGDVGTNKASRLYYWLLNRGIIVRWAMYIIPVLGLLWIPGIIGLAVDDTATVWQVKLVWWSVWLSVFWGGFWAATALFMMVPPVWRNVVGSIIPSAKQYSDVIAALGKYAKLILWTMAMWISFTPLVINHYNGDQSNRSRSDLTVMVNLLFGLFLCSIVYGVEKLLIQMIAFQFHRDSYEDRLKEQKFNIKCLATLYIHSHDIPGRSDTLRDNESHRTKASQMPKKAIRAALKGLKEAAQTTTTALGNVASEMAGQSVLQTNSPSNKVTAALTSANKSKALARRLFYSFCRDGQDYLRIDDIARFFPDLDTADAAFSMFDKDGNGDATRDEIEQAVMMIHRERLSLEASMRDLDGAVRRLDDIFMVIVFVIVVLILAAMVTTKLTTLVTSAGTFVLGLSWLIGSTMQEILLSTIFLFVKHPYDVGDRVDIDGNSYTVAKMQLMSTTFKRVDGKNVWIGHSVLATKVIENVRRSGATSETFVFDVAFDTSFDQLQSIRAKMLAFCKENGRDFLPIFDVTVDDIPAQGKMVLKADIRYKSNWQQGALKVMRRNKWICALKMALADLKVFGPAGAGNPTPAPPDPTKYTLVPYEEVQAAAAAATSSNQDHDTPPPTFASATAQATSLTDRREIVNDPSQDIWDEHLDNSTGYATRPQTPGVESAVSTGRAPALPPPVGQIRTRMPHGAPGEEFEMVSAPVARRQA